jgi:acyl-CoA thioester hydrolase
MSEFVFNDAVDFSDTDAGGLVYFTNILRWVERSEGAWFKSLGFQQFERLPDGGYRGFPRVNVKCDYRNPLFPGDTFAIRLEPSKVGHTSFTYSFKVYRGDSDGVLAAEGSITIVFASASRGGQFEVIALPAQLAALKAGE